jgi:hypothetical protein
MGDNSPWAYLFASLLVAAGLGGILILATRKPTRGTLTVAPAPEQDSFDSPPPAPEALPAPEPSGPGGWHNDEVTTIERDENGFIIRETTRRAVVFG